MNRIHPTAVVDPAARIGADVDIGPYCVVGPHVVLEEGVRLMSHVVVDHHTRLGRRCVVHPFASIGGLTQDKKYVGGSPAVEVGNDTVIRECVTINTATKDGDVTRVGSRALLMAYVHVAHDCVVGDEVILANNVQLSGHVVIEDQAIVGGIVGIHQFARIGRMAMVGGLSRVVQDIPPYMLAADTPLKVTTINSVGLTRRGVSEDVQHRLKRAFRLVYRENLTLAAAVDRMRRELEPCPEVHHLIQFLESSSRGITR